jgi:glycosyltransferase involved in cell wall biosynthesis
MVVGTDDKSAYKPMLQHPLLQGRVRFEKPSADVILFYAAADLYISPSFEDSFGLPILEAMACGLPVVASIYAGASENIRDGETGVLLQDPRDAAEIAERIHLLFTDGTLRKKIGFAAAQYAQERCSWDQNASKTKDFLEAALQGRRED